MQESSSLDFSSFTSINKLAGIIRDDYYLSIKELCLGLNANLGLRPSFFLVGFYNFFSDSARSITLVILKCEDLMPCKILRL